MSKRLLASLWATLIILTSVSQAQDFDNVQFTPIKAGENIYMLKGAGGNIGLFFGPDGLFLIDDQFAPLHQKLLTKIAELSEGAIKDFDRAFLINTHFHHDHTGGNELIGESGGLIFAHENVRQRLSAEHYVPFFDSRNPSLKPSGLPVVTFSRDLTFHLNGDSLSIIHVENAHTDGDAFVHFTKANVIHTGDILFNGTYPFFDIDNGGSVAGLIKAVDLILSLCDDQTVIIPGHGEITDKAGLLEYRLMLTTISGKVKKLADDGKTLEQIQAANPTVEFDIEYNGFISNKAFIELVFRDLNEAQK